MGLRIVPFPTGKEKADVELVDLAKNPEVLSTLICLSSAALVIEPPVPIVSVLAPVVMSAATLKFNTPLTVTVLDEPSMVNPLELLFVTLKKVTSSKA